LEKGKHVQAKKQRVFEKKNAGVKGGQDQKKGGQQKSQALLNEDRGPLSRRKNNLGGTVEGKGG